MLNVSYSTACRRRRAGRSHSASLDLPMSMTAPGRMAGHLHRRTGGAVDAWPSPARPGRHAIVGHYPVRPEACPARSGTCTRLERGQSCPPPYQGGVGGGVRQPREPPSGSIQPCSQAHEGWFRLPHRPPSPVAFSPPWKRGRLRDAKHKLCQVCGFKLAGSTAVRFRNSRAAPEKIDSFVSAERSAMESTRLPGTGSPSGNG